MIKSFSSLFFCGREMIVHLALLGLYFMLAMLPGTLSTKFNPLSGEQLRILLGEV